VLPSHDALVAELSELIAIPSVSADPAHADDLARAADWVAARIRSRYRSWARRRAWSQATGPWSGSITTGRPRIPTVIAIREGLGLSGLPTSATSSVRGETIRATHSSANAPGAARRAARTRATGTAGIR